MATSSTNAPPARRRTSLDDLPKELKALIVGMVDDQDRALPNRLSSYNEAEWTALADVERDLDGGGNGAMRLVSREWGALADARLIRELYCARCLQLDIFAFDILRRHASLVQEVAFVKGCAKEDYIVLLRSLQQLKNVVTLMLGKEPFESLFGDSEAPPTEEQARYRNAFIALGSQIEELNLPKVSSRVLAWALPPFVNLRALYFDLSETGDARGAVDLIAELPHLHTLGIFFLDTEAGHALRDATTTGRWRSASLRNLVLSSPIGAFLDGIKIFIEHFSSSSTFPPL